MAFTSLQKIGFNDVEGAGMVYYPKFFHLCHKTFEDFLDAAGGASHPQFINELHRGFPAVAINSEFSAPMRYGDIALVSLTIDRIGTSSVTFNYEIFRKRDLKLCFSAQITKVFMDTKSHAALPIPDDLRSLWESAL